MSIGQKFEQVADLVYEKGYTKGGLDASPQETVSGEIVAITDISPVEHNVAVKAESKNLLPYPYWQGSVTQSDITFTDNGDGTITANGTATARIFYSAISTSKPMLLPKGNYILTGCPSGGADNKYLISLGYRYVDAETTSRKIFKNYGDKETIVSLEKDAYVDALFGVDINQTVTNLTFKPMLRLASVADATYTPYVPDVSVATVKTCGKNLLPYPYITTTVTKNGIDFTDNGDGSVKCFGTSTANTVFTFTTSFSFIPGKTYSLMQNVDNISMYIRYKKADGADYWATSKISWQEDYVCQQVYLQIAPNKTVNSVVYPIIVEGTTYDGTWEPYIEPTNYPIAADGTVEGVTSIYPNMTINTDTQGVVVEANYYQDGKKVKENLIDMILSLGGVINE